jgi:hypothetical protein
MPHRKLIDAVILAGLLPAGLLLTGPLLTGPLLTGQILPGSGTPALAAAPGSPDWPCVQHKVAQLTSAQFWDGPQVEGLSGWQSDDRISKLIPVLLSRRLALEAAASAIGDFAAAQPDATREEALKLLFAGLLASANNERNVVMAGIERFQQRQRGRAHEIERQGAEIHQLKQRAAQDAGASKELKVAEDKYNWDVRVFTERQQSLPLACEVPVLIEQRLFQLGREIRSHMRD